MTDRPRRLRQLTRDEALRRLASVSVGRLVFTIAGLPAIRPVTTSSMTEPSSSGPTWVRV